jgi:hypothetical protein
MEHRSKYLTFFLQHWVGPRVEEELFGRLLDLPENFMASVAAELLHWGKSSA